MMLVLSSSVRSVNTLAKSCKAKGMLTNLEFPLLSHGPTSHFLLRASALGPLWFRARGRWAP